MTDKVFTVIKSFAGETILYSAIPTRNGAIQIARDGDKWTMDAETAQTLANIILRACAMLEPQKENELGGIEALKKLRDMPLEGDE